MILSMFDACMSSLFCYIFLLRKGWFSNTSFTTGLKTLPTFRPDALVFFRAKMTRASGRNVGKVFNPVVKLVLENQPFLTPEPAEKPSLHILARSVGQQVYTGIDPEVQ